jgi:nucleoside-diphosphate-sugar epimerase
MSVMGAWGSTLDGGCQTVAGWRLRRAGRSVRGMASVLIAGCGDVGTALGMQLVTDGHEVTALRRRTAGLPASFRHVAADLTRPETLAALPAGIESVVYAAAADAHSEDAYRAAYVDGLRHLLAAVGGSLRRVLYVSSTAVYGQRRGEWVDEESATEPAGFSGRVLLEGERLALGHPAGAVVRLGGIYGPGRMRLVDEVRTGRAVCPAGPPQFTNRIHRDDCAGVLRHLLGRSDGPGVWLGVDRDPVDRCTLLCWLADRLGVPRPPAGEVAAGRAGSKRCRSDKLVASGYRLRYPTFREGYGALIGHHSIL